MNFCQLTKNVRQPLLSIAGSGTSLHAGAFLLEAVIDVFNQVVLGLPRGLVPFTL